MAEIFGFTIKRAKVDNAQSFVAPSPDDGSLDVGNASGFFGQYFGTEAAVKNDFDLVKKYRQTAEHPEADQAIEDIVNEAIISDRDEPSVTINLNFVKLSDPIKKKIGAEFSHVIRLLHWNTKSHDIFKRWYIDGRVYFHKMIDTNAPKTGIVEVRYIDPRNIRKVREIEKGRPGKGKEAVVKKVTEYFIFNDVYLYI